MLGMKVSQCVSANTRLHQLCWGDWEWAYYMSYVRNTDVPVRVLLKPCYRKGLLPMIAAAVKQLLGLSPRPVSEVLSKVSLGRRLN